MLKKPVSFLLLALALALLTACVREKQQPVNEAPSS